VWTVIAFCGFGLLSYATIIYGSDWNMVVRNGKFYAPLLLMWPAHWHPSFDSTILIFAIPVACYLRWQDRKNISGVELCLGIFLPGIFSVLAGARIGIVIIPFLLVLAYIFYCKYKPALKWGIIAAGVMVSVFCPIRLHDWGKQFEDPVRKDLRTMAIDAVKEKPVFGWGTGYVSPLIRSEERARNAGLEEPYALDQFHNQYLEDMVQFGIPGILLLLLLIGWILYLGLQNKDFLMLSFLIIYLLFFGTETALANSKGLVPFTFWLCILVSTQKIRLYKPEIYC
jgi:hypothetical protein